MFFGHNGNFTTPYPSRLRLQGHRRNSRVKEFVAAQVSECTVNDSTYKTAFRVKNFIAGALRGKIFPHAGSRKISA
jgi:hypothetical protein